MTLTNEKSIGATDGSPAHSNIRKITPADLKDALAKGFDDFKEKPSHLVILAIIYPLAMLVAVNVAAGYELLPLVFPLVSGFALIGPMAAVGLYDMSRQREEGLETTWEHAFTIFSSHNIFAIVKLSILLGIIYFAWLGAAFAIYRQIFGDAVPASIAEFVWQVLTTPAGWTLIIVGCGVGFVFALVVLAFSAVSFPLLVDRDVGTATAIQTSVRAFLANPVTMLIWGLIVAGLLVIGSVPFFAGLAVVMPVLGHATWHLYRKVVEH
ncbi:MAG: DUF2189 domain-containing protein [Hyphomicrobiales bacterium]